MDNRSFKFDLRTIQLLLVAVVEAKAAAVPVGAVDIFRNVVIDNIKTSTNFWIKIWTKILIIFEFVFCVDITIVFDQSSSKMGNEG